ncbi:MAG: DUF3305 domain-containing protein [Proteobacteria bacterium]|nr:DUF3305 domain-containing protein [Pseudomonadota bacterium]
MVAPLVSLLVGVVVERRKAVSQWTDYVWRPLAVLPAVPAAPPWTQLDGDATCASYFIGTAQIALYRSETALYRDNLASGAPALWVILRSTDGDPAVALVAVTADPSEGEAYTEAGSDLVEIVPMPQSVRDTIDAFIVEHHVEQPFVKRQRDRTDTHSPARRDANGRKDEPRE